MASIETTSAVHPGRPVSGDSPARTALCLHCSTGSSRQWSALAATLAAGRRVVAPDLLGYGENPPWPHDWSMDLNDEVRRLLPVIMRAGGPVDMVGHSFGAAVAIKLALEHPALVRSLCVYEPVLFGLLREDADSTAALTEILMTCALVGGSLTRGDADAAAARFIDFWSGDGTWCSMPESRREIVRGRIHKVRADFDALFGDGTTIEALTRLNVPVLCLSGNRSPAAVRRIADLLSETLPSVTSERFEAAGHMGPLTHASEVNSSIERFFKFLSQREMRIELRKSYTPIAARAA